MWRPDGPLSRSSCRRPASTGPAPSSATATTAGRCWCSPASRAGPGTTRTTGWWARSPTWSRAAGSSSTASTPTTPTPGRTARSRSRPGPSGTAPTSPGSPSRSPASSARTRPGVGEVIVTGCSLGAYHALNFALTRARPVPGRDLPERQLRPVAVARVGRPRGRGVLHEPEQLRAQPARRPPRLAAQPGAPRAHRGRGCVGDRAHRLAAVGPAHGRAARRARGSPTSSTCGATTPRTTGPGGRSRSPTTCPGSAKEVRMGVPGNPPPPTLAATELFAVDAYRTEFDATVAEVDRERQPGPAVPHRVLPRRRRPAVRPRHPPDAGRRPRRDRRTP